MSEVNSIVYFMCNFFSVLDAMQNNIQAATIHIRLVGFDCIHSSDRQNG